MLGLIVSSSMVNKAVVEMLIDCLTKNWMKDDLPKAATIVYLQNGITTVSAVIVAYIADYYLGRFKMIFICTFTYITGLMLFWFLLKDKSSKFVLVYVAALVVALGKSGLDSILKAFLADQLSERENPNIDSAKIESRTNFWWWIASFSGLAIALFCISSLKWPETFKFSAGVMGGSLLLFFCGFKYYHQKPTERPLDVIFKVFRAAISKRDLEYPHDSAQFYWKGRPNEKLLKNHSNQILLLPRVLFFRWLDKAAAKKSNGSQEDQNRCVVEQVTEVKSLLTLIPMCTTFFAYSLVHATGNTFFIEQGSNMDPPFATDKVTLTFFLVLNSFIRFIIPLLFRWKKARHPHVTLLRIGLGMVCSILSCVAAWQVEVQRLKKIRDEIAPGDKRDKIISMSILWLLPQFTLLGLMEGFTHEGLAEFFDNHILSKSMRNYGPLFTECVLGFGNFFSIPCVLLFKSWFKDTENESHLDRYFLALAILSSVFLGFYVYTSISKYAHEEDLLKEVELANASQEEDGGNDQITVEGHPSPSPSVSNTTQADGSGEDKAESRPNKSQFYNLWRKVFTITATTRNLYSGLTNVEMVGMQSPEDLHYPESIEELPLRSPDDEPSSLQE